MYPQNKFPQKVTVPTKDVSMKRVSMKSSNKMYFGETIQISLLLFFDRCAIAHVGAPRVSQKHETTVIARRHLFCSRGRHVNR